MKEIIYVPTLHSALAPPGLPEGLLFIHPGLGACPPESFTPPGLPLGAREAGAVLEELLALGAAFSAGGDLKLAAGQGWLEREEARKRDLRAEFEDLENFAKNMPDKDGAIPEGNRWTRAAAGPPAASLAEQFINSHKTLLLAWEHEEDVITVGALESRIADGEKRLASALGDGLADEAATWFPSPPRPEYSWRIVLDALSAFLPEHAALFTAFGPMTDDLRAQGMLEPLPANMLEDLGGWPETLTASLLTACLPMWRILGYAELPADRPWLADSREIFAAARLNV